jgi:hypothetical protein
MEKPYKVIIMKKGLLVRWKGRDRCSGEKIYKRVLQGGYDQSTLYACIKYHNETT